MRIYGITIKPSAPFGTPLKGDTIFGHFCWQTIENPDLLSGGLDKWIDCYADNPFAVFSSAWPVLQSNGKQVCAIARPAGLQVDSDNKGSRRAKIIYNKTVKKKKWLLVDSSMQVKMVDECLKSDTDLFDIFLQTLEPVDARPLRLLAKDQQKLCISINQAHNSINRLTSSTGNGDFAPFNHDNFQFIPGLSLMIFVAVNGQAMGAEQLWEGFERIGCWGYGRDASAGLGRFTVESVVEQVWPEADESATGCYTLGPSVPQKETFVRCHAVPFTRFGRHGSVLARSANPFKKPVIMADEGAVLYPVDRKTFALPYVGTAVKNVSAVDSRTVVQGYSLYLPC